MHGAGSGVMKIFVAARDAVAHTSNSPCIWEADAEGSGFRGQSWLQREFEAILVYTRSASQNKTNQKNKNLFNQ